jgi:hypothetical protein
MLEDLSDLKRIQPVLSQARGPPPLHPTSTTHTALSLWAKSQTTKRQTQRKMAWEGEVAEGRGKQALAVRRAEPLHHYHFPHCSESWWRAGRVLDLLCD